jgi:hypothetical protein
MGRHFAEATLLKTAAALEQCVGPIIPQLAEAVSTAGQSAVQLAEAAAAADDTCQARDQLHKPVMQAPKQLHLAQDSQRRQPRPLTGLLRWHSGRKAAPQTTSTVDDSHLPA